MKTWELLLSESQERMLMVVEKGKESMVTAVFEKWDLPCVNIGEVTSDGLLKFYMHGTLEAEIPAFELVLGGGAPVYERAYSEPSYMKQVRAFDPSSIPVPAAAALKGITEKLVALPGIASKKWIYTQYDSMVGLVNISTNAPSDAAVVWVHENNSALAVTTDCNSRYVYADPHKGAMIAVAEAARNIVCSGGTPLGVTNCLNFGNPYDPEVYYQFVEAVKGMGEACIRFDTPVTGGNVSFYNQNPDGPVYPTPTIGMVGLLADAKRKMTMGFLAPDREIYLLGTVTNDINCSDYLHQLCGVTHSPAPYFNLEEEYRVQQAVAALISEGLVESAHDLSEGGLMVALLESAFVHQTGFSIEMDEAIRSDAFLFGEGQGRVLLSMNTENTQVAKQRLQNLPFKKLGKTTDGNVVINGEIWGGISEWKTIYDESLSTHFKQS
jgi:phosphoribosylformylglycinamidine synthase